MSKLIEIIRIEDKRNNGPWSSPVYYEIHTMLNRRFNSKTHERHGGKTVRFEFGDSYFFLFGCPSRKALTEYFGVRLINMMLRRGFSIKTYHIDEKYVRYGDGEVAFIPEDMQGMHDMEFKRRDASLRALDKLSTTNTRERFKINKIILDEFTGLDLKPFKPDESFKKYEWSYDIDIPKRQSIPSGIKSA